MCHRVVPTPGALMDELVWFGLWDVGGGVDGRKGGMTGLCRVCDGCTGTRCVHLNGWTGLCSWGCGSRVTSLFMQPQPQPPNHPTDPPQTNTYTQQHNTHSAPPSSRRKRRTATTAPTPPIPPPPAAATCRATPRPWPPSPWRPRPSPWRTRARPPTSIGSGGR